MINIIPSNKRHHGQYGWLDAHWHFSFGDYQDPNNMNWGALRVFTDDIIHAVGGFDIHPIAIWKLSPLFTGRALPSGRSWKCRRGSGHDHPTLSAGDQGRIDHETHLDIAAKEDADLILLDLP
jgi:hypothetical protein